MPKGPNANPALAAMNGADNTTTKAQVKHVLSKELQLYFEKVCASILDETQPEYRTAGLASLKEDPGLHQLVPYFVQFVAEKVTHNLKDLFVLTQMMLLTEALTRNEKLNLTPYVRQCFQARCSITHGWIGSINGAGGVDLFNRANLGHGDRSPRSLRPSRPGCIITRSPL